MDFTDLTVERGILAAIISKGTEVYLDVCDLINSDSFVGEEHSYIYMCIEHILKDKETRQSVDIPTILVAARDVGCQLQLNTTEIKTYIKNLSNTAIDDATPRNLAQRLKKLQIASQLYNTTKESQKQLVKITGQEKLSEIIGIVETPIFNFSANLTDGNINEPKLLGASMDTYFNEITTNIVDQVGIPTGYKLYDNAIGGGLRKGSLNLVVARMKVGKSFFGSNVAVHISKNLDIPTLYLDTEMDENEARVRVLSKISGVNSKLIETGQFSTNPVLYDKVKEGIETIKKIPYHYVNISGLAFDEIISIMRRWVMRYGNGTDAVIIYDYLKLMSGDYDGDAKEYEKLGQCTIRLKDFASRYSIPILSFCQLNRDGITKESTDIVAGSDRILWFASNAFLFKQKSVEELAEEQGQYGNRKLVGLGVQRHGEGLPEGSYINFQADFAQGNLIELGMNQQKSEFKTENKDEELPF